MLKAKTNIIEISKSKYLLIPSLLINDSAFPFKKSDNIEIKIYANYLVIQKVRRKRK